MGFNSGFKGLNFLDRVSRNINKRIFTKTRSVGGEWLFTDGRTDGAFRDFAKALNNSHKN